MSEDWPTWIHRPEGITYEPAYRKGLASLPPRCSEVYVIVLDRPPGWQLPTGFEAKGEPFYILAQILLAIRCTRSTYLGTSLLTQ